MGNFTPFRAEEYDQSIGQTLPYYAEMHQCGFDTAEVLWASYMQAGFLGVKH